jgi:signal transduction histidine kinase
MSAVDYWQRPGPTARQRHADLLIGSAVMAAALLNVVLLRSVGVVEFGVRRSVGEMLIWAAAVTVPLLWRRVHPEAVLLVTAVVFIAGQVRGAQESQIASGAINAAIYAVGAWGRDRARARWVRIAVLGAMFVWLAASWMVAADRFPPGGKAGASGELPPLLSAIVNSILINMLVLGFAYLFGETAWLAARREYQLRVQADELRAARAAAEERAVFGERVRIARELHDVVAHHVSVMGIQAAAARRAMEKDTGKARSALASVEQSARTAVDELHVMLAALRASEAADTGTVYTGTADPAGVERVGVERIGIERVGDLAERARTAGLEIRSAVLGNPVPLPASLSQTVYRIAQEAVTNTLKHASASTVDIRVRYLAREVELDVTDDGVGGPPNPGRPGGLGLVGMRERVALHGGTVEAGPRDGGGFRVRARIPMPASVMTGDPVTAAPEGDCADAVAADVPFSNLGSGREAAAKDRVAGGRPAPFEAPPPAARSTAAIEPRGPSPKSPDVEAAR